MKKKTWPQQRIEKKSQRTKWTEKRVTGKLHLTHTHTNTHASAVNEVCSRNSSSKRKKEDRERERVEALLMLILFSKCLLPFSIIVLSLLFCWADDPKCFYLSRKHTRVYKRRQRRMRNLAERIQIGIAIGI